MKISSWLVALPITALLVACSASTTEDAPTSESTGVVSQALPKEGDDNWEPPYNGSFGVHPASYWYNTLTCPYADKPYMHCNVYNSCHCSAY